MRVVIVRHGEAESFINAASDAARKLTPRGRSDVKHLGDRLAGEGFDVQRIIASPYLRAQQTAALLAAKLSDDDVLTTAPELQPDCSPGVAMNLIDATALDTVLIVSHQPLVGRLLKLLVDEGELPLFMPACCAVIKADVLAAGCAELVSFMAPGDK